MGNPNIPCINGIDAEESSSEERVAAEADPNKERVGKKGLLIGFTLRWCIYDMLEGLVNPNEVYRIITLAEVENGSIPGYVLAECARTEWAKDPRKAVSIVRQLEAEGKFISVGDFGSNRGKEFPYIYPFIGHSRWTRISSDIEEISITQDGIVMHTEKDEDCTRRIRFHLVNANEINGIGNVATWVISPDSKTLIYHPYGEEDSKNVVVVQWTENGYQIVNAPSSIKDIPIKYSIRCFEDGIEFHPFNNSKSVIISPKELDGIAKIGERLVIPININR